MDDKPVPAVFRSRLLAGELLLGTFIKTPVTHPVEILGAVGFDFVVLDQEHAPFDRVTVDTLVLAGQAAGIAVLPDIVATAGLDAVFIGRGDLGTALGADSPSAPPVVAATEKIAAAARAAGKSLCAHVGKLDSPEVAWLRSLGVSAFILSSDQGLMRSAALQALAQFRSLRDG